MAEASAEMIAKWEEVLNELELLEEGEHVETHEQGDFWDFGGQHRGHYYFTDRKVIFVGGFGLNQVAIPYKSIQAIKPCNVSLFIPTGIKVTAINEKGKNQNYKLSVMGRKKWMAFLSAKTGIACE